VRRKALVLLTAAFVSGCAAAPGDVELVAGWTQEREAQVFRGAELYGHINGGSEIFLELGFDYLVVQEFRRGEAEVSIDHYHMLDPVAALGIYLMKCGVETPAAQLAARNTASDLQIHLVHGSSYVTVNNLSGTPDAAASLVEFASQLLSSLPPADAVEVFDRLPAEGRVPGTERIIRGPFTLQAVYTLGEGDVLQFVDDDATALSAEYGLDEAPTTRISVDYGTAEDASAAFVHLVENLDSYLEVVSQDATHLVFKDWTGQYGEVTVLASRIDIRVHLSADPTGS